MSTKNNQPISPVHEWAKYTIERWVGKITALKIGDSGALKASFQDFIESSANGDIERIKFMYLYYGAFVDMGVGKGQKIGETKEAALERRLLGTRKGGRRAKKWYGKTLRAETLALASIMQQHYGIKATNHITETLPERI